MRTVMQTTFIVQLRKCSKIISLIASYDVIGSFGYKSVITEKSVPLIAFVLWFSGDWRKHKVFNAALVLTSRYVEESIVAPLSTPRVCSDLHRKNLFKISQQRFVMETCPIFLSSFFAPSNQPNGVKSFHVLDAVCWMSINAGTVDEEIRIDPHGGWNNKSFYDVMSLVLLRAVDLEPVHGSRFPTWCPFRCSMDMLDRFCKLSF